MSRLNKLRELIVSAAVDHLAVAEFPDISEGYSMQDNSDALIDFKIERDDSLLEVINFVLVHGAMLRLQLVAEQAEKIAESGRRFSNT